MIRLTFVLIFIFYNIVSFGQAAKVIKLDHQKCDGHYFWTNCMTQLIVKRNNKTIDKIKTDTNKIWIISENSIYKNKTIDIYISSNANEAYYLTSINQKSEDTIIVRLPKDYSDLDIKCPICQKSNRIIETLYGCGNMVSAKMKRGEWITSPVVGNKFHMGGSIPCEFGPKYYCKKDCILF